MLLHAFSFATVAMTLSGGKSVLDNSLGDAHIGISVRHLNVFCGIAPLRWAIILSNAMIVVQEEIGLHIYQ